MTKFAKKRNIEQVKTPPGHLAANNEGDIADHNVVPDNSDNNNDWKKVFEFTSNNDHVSYDDSKQNYYIPILL